MTDEAIIIPDQPKPRSRKTTTSADKIIYRENVKKAIKLRIDGFTYDEILDDLPGVWKSIQACQQAVSRQLEKAILDAASELKLLSLKRLEKCMAAVLKKAENGHLLAVDRVIRLTKREGEILGFDAEKDNDLSIGFELVIKDETERPKE